MGSFTTPAALTASDVWVHPLRVLSTHEDGTQTAFVSAGATWAAAFAPGSGQVGHVLFGVDISTGATASYVKTILRHIGLGVEYEVEKKTGASVQAVASLNAGDYRHACKVDAYNGDSVYRTAHFFYLFGRLI